MTLIVLAQRTLWILAPSVQGLLIWKMWTRDLARQVPCFFAYNVFHIIKFVLLFSLYHISYTKYFYSYWGSEAVDAILVLVVIQEIFSVCCQDYRGLEQLTMLIFRWSTLILVGLAILSAAAAPGVDSDRVVAGLITMQRSVNFVQCGLLFLLVLISRTTGLGFGSPAMGIGVGFGAMASVITVVMAVRGYLGISTDLMSLAMAAAYNIAVAIWVVALLYSSKASSSERLLTSSRVKDIDLSLRRIFE